MSVSCCCRLNVGSARRGMNEMDRYKSWSWKHQTFSSNRFFNETICCFSLSFMTLNEESLGLNTLWWAFFTLCFFGHFLDKSINLLNLEIICRLSDVKLSWEIKSGVIKLFQAYFLFALHHWVKEETCGWLEYDIIITWTELLFRCAAPVSVAWNLP